MDSAGKPILERLGCRIGEHSIRAFIWSGANSHTARVRAGRDLAEFANKLCLTEGIQRIWCVAHSHGGNVVLYALRDERFSARLAGIAFLGTPFLLIRRRDMPKFCQTAMLISGWALGIVCLIASLIGQIWAFARFFPNVPDELFAMAALSISLGAVFLIVWVLSKFVPSRFQNFLSRKQEEIVGWLAQPTPSCPTYVATVQRDEASISLTIVDKIAAMPWIGWSAVAKSSLTIFLSWYLLSGFISQLFGGPVGTGSGTISYVALAVTLVITLGPLFATLFAASLRRAPFAFGWEGLVAASTVRIQPSHIPPWNENKNFSMQYLPNPSVRGYRHSFFYKDERVINDVATWIRLSLRNDSYSTLERAVEPSVTVQDSPAWVVRAVGSPWFINITALLVMVAIFIWSSVGDMREFNTPKFELSPDVRSIRDGAAPPTLEINKAVQPAKYPPAAIFVSSIRPYIDVVDEMSNVALDVSRGTTCVIEGDVTFSSVNMMLKIYIYQNDHLSEPEKTHSFSREYRVRSGSDRFSDDERREIWKWSADHGKVVHFRRRFNYDPAPPAGRLALGVRNEASSRQHVEAKVYAQCL
jgi:hypothetical protein